MYNATGPFDCKTWRIYRSFQGMKLFTLTQARKAPPKLHIGWREIAVMASIYLAFATLYAATLLFNSPDPSFATDFNYFIYIDYALKGIMTLPFWWITFRWLRKQHLALRVALHFLMAPLFAYIWREAYYYICDLANYYHLRGAGAVWDIYIPILFYLIQFSLFHVYEYYLRLLEEERHAQQLREAALQSELTALKAQLNPHFLYNTFNTINASVPAHQESTRELVANLADLFRYQLRASKEDLVPLRDEFDFVQKYLALEKARFGDRLQLDVHIPSTTQLCEVPPMILQPLVENAIKHGIAPLIEGGKVSLWAALRGDNLELNVTDTGQGMDPSQLQSSRGIGLANTRKRLRLQYGVDLQVKQHHPRGTHIHFAIPMQIRFNHKNHTKDSKRHAESTAH